jgi:hypothetical protein
MERTLTEPPIDLYDHRLGDGQRGRHPVLGVLHRPVQCVRPPRAGGSDHFHRPGKSSGQADGRSRVAGGAASPETGVELLRATFQAFNPGDLGACVAGLAPTFVINLAELPGPWHGPETWRQGVEMRRQACPGLRADIEGIVWRCGWGRRPVQVPRRALRRVAGCPGRRAGGGLPRPGVLPHAWWSRCRGMGLLRHGHCRRAAGRAHRVTPVCAAGPACPGGRRCSRTGGRCWWVRRAGPPPGGVVAGPGGGPRRGARWLWGRRRGGWSLVSPRLLPSGAPCPGRADARSPPRVSARPAAD